MKTYERVARYVSRAVWAITEDKLAEIEAILQFHMAGGKYTAEELRARLGDPTPAAASLKRGAVAIVPLQGVISHRMGGMTEMSGGMSTERFSAMFRQALADDSVSAIIIDTNSPGGTVAGLTETAAEIYAARGRKPIIAHVNALAASAGYWLAASADEIVSTPSGEVGSIGIIVSHLDDSKAEEAEGITRTVISAGKHKAEGHGPLTDEAKAAWKARVDEAYGVMVADIARGRGVKAGDIRNGYAEGRVVSAKEALKLGMIDKIATLDETIVRLVGRQQSAGMRADVIEVPLVAVDPSLANPTLAIGQITNGDADADRRRRMERF